jgi:phosphoglycolate phosphatase
MTPPRALIFDLDGTLVDSLGDIAAACNHVLAGEGLPEHPLTDYRVFVGEGIRRLVERAAPGLARERTAALVTAVRARYEAHLVERTRPYPGVLEALTALRRAGLPLAVLSNKPHDLTERVVAALLGATPFVAVDGERAGRPRKPDPAGAIAVAAALGTAPGETWLVGDTRIDMETAAAAGMVPVGVLWGFRDRAELEASGARQVVATPAELVNLAARGV